MTIPRFRGIGRSRILLFVLLAVATTTGLVIVLTASSSTPDFFERCLALEPGLSGEKLAAQEAECHAREAAAAKFSPQEIQKQKARIAEQPHTGPEQPPTSRQTGILTGAEGPVGTSQIFHSTGRWSGESGGNWYLVYAGAKVEPETNANVRSELLIYRQRQDLASDAQGILVGTYEPPEGGTAPLELVGEAGDVLTVRTGDGKTLSFDVATRTFRE